VCRWQQAASTDALPYWAPSATAPSAATSVRLSSDSVSMINTQHDAGHDHERHVGRRGAGQGSDEEQAAHTSRVFLRPRTSPARRRPERLRRRPGTGTDWQPSLPRLRSCRGRRSCRAKRPRSLGCRSRRAGRRGGGDGQLRQEPTMGWPLYLKRVAPRSLGCRHRRLISGHRNVTNGSVRLVAHRAFCRNTRTTAVALKMFVRTNCSRFGSYGC
jgi:hypothetical protein